MKRSRDERALKRKSTWGKQVAAGEWAISEWNALSRCWELGLPVPYPVQIDETEILMEWITVTVDGEVDTAPRVAQVRPDAGPASSVLLRAAARRRWPRWCRRASCTATCRRTTPSPPASGWSSSTSRRSSTSSATRSGMDFLLRDCANMCTLVPLARARRRRAGAVRGADGARLLARWSRARARPGRARAARRGRVRRRHHASPSSTAGWPRARGRWPAGG